MKRLALTILLLNALFTSVMSQTKEITLSRAVRLAEEFVIRNGYTDLPPSKDKNEIKLEPIERYSNIDAILADRRNTLERRAYGGKVRPDVGGWIVVFRYKDKERNAKSGRVVTMGPKGENIRMEHQDFLLNHVERLSR